MKDTYELPTVESTLQKASVLSLMNERRRHAAQHYQQSLVIGYEGGLFKADAVTISFAKLLIDNSAIVVMVDINNNPIFIQDPAGFLDELIAAYNEATILYYSQIEEINQCRSKEGLTHV